MYKRQGLTTLRDRHVDIDGGDMRFAFKGKSGRTWKLRVQDRRIARIVKACQHIPGQHLFQYYDEEGQRHPVTSSDVNGYLREATGREITAKDFRTWHGTVLAAVALKEFEAIDGAARTKKAVREAIERVAARLGNTPTICRKCYVHPEVVNAYLEGGLLPEVREDIEQEVRQELSHDLHALKPEEAALLALLQARLADARDPGTALRQKLNASLEGPRPARPRGGKAAQARAAAKVPRTPPKDRPARRRSSS